MTTIAAAIFSVAVSGVAKAEVVRLSARAGGRVELAVPAGLRRRALKLIVDGRRIPIAGRRPMFSIRGLTSSSHQPWHRLKLYDSTATATARFAVGSRTGANAPTLLLTSAPSAHDDSHRAKFAYSSDAAVSCTLDGRSHRCSRRAANLTVSAGRHVFRLRALNAGGAAVLSWDWTVKGVHRAQAPKKTPTSAPGRSSTGSATGSSGSSSTSSPADGEAGWKLLMSDDFDGTTINTNNWSVYGPDWPGNGGNGVRDGSAVSVGGGVLTITAQMVNGTLVSGAVSSQLNLTYGRVEFRVRTDADPSEATSGVVLMWPQSNIWPEDGELDVYETGTNPTRSWFSSFVHYGADNEQYWFGHDADATQWHEMAMDWTPDSITFYRDGILEGTVTNPAAIPTTPHHLCIQLDAFSPTMAGVVRMQVEDVRMYAPSS